MGCVRGTMYSLLVVLVSVPYLRLTLPNGFMWQLMQKNVLSTFY